MDEIWKPVIYKGKSYKGIYEVSCTGKVRSLDRTITNSKGQLNNYKGKELKKCIDGNGYFSVTLSYKNKTRSYYVHGLVMEAFGRELKFGECVDHTKGKLNNNFNTLRILTNRKNSSIEKTEKRALPLGVYQSANKKSFYAQIYLLSLKKTIGIGTYRSYQAAAHAHTIVLKMIEKNENVSVKQVDLKLNKYRGILNHKPIQKRRT